MVRALGMRLKPLLLVVVLAMAAVAVLAATGANAHTREKLTIDAMIANAKTKSLLREVGKEGERGEKNRLGTIANRSFDQCMQVHMYVYN